MFDGLGDAFKAWGCFMLICGVALALAGMGLLKLVIWVFSHLRWV